MPVSLYSEPYGSTGNIGENFRRLLGTPSLDPLQTVIREAVQNVSDAAKLGRGPDCVIRLRELDECHKAFLREELLVALPREAKSQESLNAFLSREDAIVLEICDFNTTGLGGPTRADRIPVGEERTDFIDFLRNIGTPRDTKHGGGTYGFGKVALYRISRCSTILVDTLVAGSEDNARRIMGCHIGSSFELQDNHYRRRFTGRHWWGTDPGDGIVDPVTGEEASRLAKSLGLPDRRGDRTGTSIMILDFDAGDEDLLDVGQRIVETLLWNFWPRMMRDLPAERRFTCSVMVNDQELEIPFPEDFPGLDLFAKAMRSARNGQGNDVQKIECRSPKKNLGVLAVEKGLRTPRYPLVSSDSLIPDPVNHIALMRPVELVVRYLEGSALPDEKLEWAGVFLSSSDDDVERAFAEAEPPAHDDWIPDNLDNRHHRTFVRVALRRLRQIALEAGDIPTTGLHESSSKAPPLASVAARLGSVLMGGTEGNRGTSSPHNKGNRRKSGVAKSSPPVFVRLETDGDSKIAVFQTDVQQDVGRNGATLTAKASLAVDGGSQLPPGTSIPIPEVVDFKNVETGKIVKSSQYSLKGEEGIFEIRVRVPGNFAVTLEASVATSGEQ